MPNDTLPPSPDDIGGSVETIAAASSLLELVEGSFPITLLADPGGVLMMPVLTAISPLLLLILAGVEALPLTKIVSSRCRRLFSCLFSCASLCSREIVMSSAIAASFIPPPPLPLISWSPVFLGDLRMLRREERRSSLWAIRSCEREYFFLSPAAVWVASIDLRTEFSRLPMISRSSPSLSLLSASVPIPSSPAADELATGLLCIIPVCSWKFAAGVSGKLSAAFFHHSEL
mmetsp:Transcript_23406/g.37612  ORF Transcript_23406/g.37612 Transcript_23406/m.37612 type:complete len:231 (+) Transcript_23406:491-1183(+)